MKSKHIRFQKFVFLLSPVMLFFIVSLQVILPKGYIIAGGDFYQLTNYQANVSKYLYSWFNQVGQGGFNPLTVTYPYYLLLTIIETIIGTNMIAFATLFLFLTASYYSYFFSMKYILPKQKWSLYAIPSLIYGLNNFVLMMFSYTWGFTHHFLLYPFFPMLAVSFHKLWITKKHYYLHFSIYLFITVVSLPSMNNVAFIFLLYLFELLLFIALIATKIIIISIRNLIKFILLVTAQLVIHIWLIIPALYTVLNNKVSLTDSKALGGANYLEGWIRSTSSNFLNVLTLTLDQYKFPYISQKNSIIFILISFTLPILLFFLMSKKNKATNSFDGKKILNVYILLFLMFGILAVRLFPPWDILLKHLYLSPGFIFFRSPDKIFAVFPYIYCTILFMLLYRKKFNIKYIWLLVIIFFIPWILPIARFLLNADYNRFAHKEMPEYSYIVSVPKEYKNAANIINSDNSARGVVSIPYSVINSINWSNYPKWNFVGHDILHLYFNVPYISANTFDNPARENQFSFKIANQETSTKDNLLHDLNRFGANYIIYHKDIDESWIKENAHLSRLIDDLTVDQKLVLLDDNNFFKLYKLQNNVIPEVLESSVSKIQFKKINPTLYVYSDSVRGTDRTITFRQSFDPAWELYFINNTFHSATEGNISTFKTVISLLNKKPIKKHYECLNYANCWDINNQMDDVESGQFVIFYRYQYLVYGLQATCGILLLITVSYIIKNRKK